MSVQPPSESSDRLAPPRPRLCCSPITFNACAMTHRPAKEREQNWSSCANKEAELSAIANSGVNI